MAVMTRTISPEKTSEENITRFDIHQIVQHIALMTSFILLVVTGLPLKFHALAISQWWTGIWGGIEVIRSTHHFAAWVMGIVCLYHIAYLCYNILILKRPFPVKMIPAVRTCVTFCMNWVIIWG